MLHNPTSHASASKTDFKGSFSEGSPEINLRFGKKLQTLREQQSLSQEELAVQLLIPMSYLSDLESGRRSASIIDLDSIANHFKLSTAELLNGF